MVFFNVGEDNSFFNFTQGHITMLSYIQQIGFQRKTCKIKLFSQNRKHDILGILLNNDNMSLFPSQHTPLKQNKQEKKKVSGYQKTEVKSFFSKTKRTRVLWKFH